MTRRATIDDYMTRSPHSIGQEQSLQVAHELMRKYAVRHLPVLHAGKLVGLLSLRDLHLVETLPDVDPSRVTVEEAMSGDPFAVPPGSDLAEVADQMAENKYGSAVVMDGQKIVGVFTTVDGMRALAQLLRSAPPAHPPPP